MNSAISQKEIGQRIAKLRKIKGFSQEDLAKSIDMSRPSLAQIELGNRNLDILEIQRLSIVLRFSLDDFMSEDFLSEKKAEESSGSRSAKAEERISIPELQISKFKNVLLYILEKCAGRPNVGETVLYKLLYFSDFNYYELYEEHLTGAKYRKLPFGPVPQQLDQLIGEMIENNLIQRVKTQYHGYPQTRFLPLEKADLTQFKASEKDVIDKVLDQMGDWSATVISNYSHGDKPWKATQNNEEINYELVFYRRLPYSVRIYNEDGEN